LLSAPHDLPLSPKDKAVSGEGEGSGRAATGSDRSDCGARKQETTRNNSKGMRKKGPSKQGKKRKPIVQSPRCRRRRHGETPHQPQNQTRLLQCTSYPHVRAILQADAVEARRRLVPPPRSPDSDLDPRTPQVFVAPPIRNQPRAAPRNDVSSTLHPTPDTRHSPLPPPLSRAGKRPQVCLRACLARSRLSTARELKICVTAWMKKRHEEGIENRSNAPTPSRHRTPESHRCACLIGGGRDDV